MGATTSPPASPGRRWPSGGWTTPTRSGACSTPASRSCARCGTTSRPRVADIVEAAGLSNDAFYRHFPSKDALVTAILDDGAERLRGYLAHQMAKATTPQDQVRRWVEGVLSQADAEIAATTLAVLWNGGAVDGTGAGRHFASATLATLLHEPFAALGSVDPELDASLVAHAAMGKLSDHLWQGVPPSPADLDGIDPLLPGRRRGLKPQSSASGTTVQVIGLGRSSARKKRQKMEPAAWPSVSNQLATPGSWPAITMR